MPKRADHTGGAGHGFGVLMLMPVQEE